MSSFAEIIVSRISLPTAAPDLAANFGMVARFSRPNFDHWEILLAAMRCSSTSMSYATSWPTMTSGSAYTFIHKYHTGPSTCKTFSGKWWYTFHSWQCAQKCIRPNQLHSSVFTPRRSFAEYWKYLVVRFNDVHAFGYNSAGSERICQCQNFIRKFNVQTLAITFLSVSGLS